MSEAVIRLSTDGEEMRVMKMHLSWRLCATILFLALVAAGALLYKGATGGVRGDGSATSVQPMPAEGRAFPGLPSHGEQPDLRPLPTLPVRHVDTGIEAYSLQVDPVVQRDDRLAHHHVQPIRSGVSLPAGLPDDDRAMVPVPHGL